MVLVGKKVVLFPLERVDFRHFVKLHREDKYGYMCRFSLADMAEEEAVRYVAALLATGDVIPWTVMTKEGRAARKAGYIYLTDLDSYSATIAGIMDKEFVKGLVKQIRRGKYTFSQDAFHTLLKFCFEELELERVMADVVNRNRTAVNLVVREGFKKEGLLRNYIKLNGSLYDVAVFGLLRGEWQNGANRKIEKKESPKVS